MTNTSSLTHSVVSSDASAFGDKMGIHEVQISSTEISNTIIRLRREGYHILHILPSRLLMHLGAAEITWYLIVYEKKKMWTPTTLTDRYRKYEPTWEEILRGSLEGLSEIRCSDVYRILNVKMNNSKTGEIITRIMYRLGFERRTVRRGPIVTKMWIKDDESR